MPVSRHAFFLGGCGPWVLGQGGRQPRSARQFSYTRTMTEAITRYRTEASPLFQPALQKIFARVSLACTRVVRDRRSGRAEVRALSFLLGILFLTGGVVAEAQAVAPQKLVQAVVKNEIAADRNDHSHWMYRDAEKTPSKDTVKMVVETSNGTVSKTILQDGHALTEQEQEQDREKMERVVNDPAARARQKKNSAHDDSQAESLMKMLPDAFLWTEGGEAKGEITLYFKPNPAFEPPTYASRVFAAMAGKMVVDGAQKRLMVLSGTLLTPVEFGWGLLGKLQQGGTFHIVRSELAPGIWEITETHVHIEGHALFFKSISEQQDEVTSNYQPSPATLTVKQAAQMLTDGEVARLLGLDAQAGGGSATK